MKNRLVYIIMALVLVFAVGCGSKEPVDTETETSSEALTTEAETEAETIAGTETDEETEEESLPVEITALEAELSGSGGDVFTAEEPSYIISDKYIIYVDKGVSIPGDTEKFINNVMAALEEVSGMSYDNELFVPENRERAVTTEMTNGRIKGLGTFSNGASFGDLDAEHEKMCVYIVPQAKEAWAYDNGIYLRQADLIGEGRRVAITELAELLCLRRGNVSLGPSIDGGMKGYMTQIVCERHPELGISFDGFTFYNGIENSLITEKNGSNLICTSHGFEAECIGFRFMVFVNEMYNGEIIKNVYDSCAAYRQLFMGKNSGAVTTQKMVQLVKKETSEQVFTEFYQWYTTNAERFGDLTYGTGESEGETLETDEFGNIIGTEEETIAETERDWQSFFEALFGK